MNDLSRRALLQSAAALTGRGQAIHDRIAHTRVIRA